MSVLERERAHREAFEREQGRIREAVKAIADLVSLSAEIAEDTGIEQQTVYRWIQEVERSVDRRRRALAVRAAALLWVGVAAVLGGIGALVFSWSGQGMAIALVAVGAALTGLAAWLLSKIEARVSKYLL